jgi:hypothetical protein
MGAPRRTVHFAVLGGLLFAAFGSAIPVAPARPVIQAASQDAADDQVLLHEAWAAGLDEKDKIVRERLVALGRDLRLAAPDDAVGLERAARALGLQRSDPLIRRYLIDLMRLAAAGPPERDGLPDDAVLRAAYEADPLRDAVPPRATFTHVFLSRERRGERLASDAEAVLATLRAQPPDLEAAAAGDPFVRGARLRRASEAELARVFGRDFAARVLALEPGRWSEPLASPYGLHLVKVAEQLPAAAPGFDAVRARLLHAHLRDRRAERYDATLARLRARYQLRIDPSANL